MGSVGAKVAGSEIVPLVDEGLGNSSYLVPLGDGRALVLDARRDPRAYLALAKNLNLRIAFAVETHLHADFISGSRELAAFGAAIIAPRASRLATAYRGLDDGDEVDLGGLTLRALATPGHTPEHLAYLLLDGSKPLALFSGGAILPGGAARPDLIGPEQTEPLDEDDGRSASQHRREDPGAHSIHPSHLHAQHVLWADRDPLIQRLRSKRPRAGRHLDLDQPPAAVPLQQGAPQGPPLQSERVSQPDLGLAGHQGADAHTHRHRLGRRGHIRVAAERPPEYRETQHRARCRLPAWRLRGCSGSSHARFFRPRSTGNGPPASSWFRRAHR